GKNIPRGNIPANNIPGNINTGINTDILNHNLDLSRWVISNPNEFKNGTYDASGLYIQKSSVSSTQNIQMRIFNEHKNGKIELILLKKPMRHNYLAIGQGIAFSGRKNEYLVELKFLKPGKKEGTIKAILKFDRSNKTISMRTTIPSDIPHWTLKQTNSEINNTSLIPEEINYEPHGRIPDFNKYLKRCHRTLKGSFVDETNQRIWHIQQIEEEIIIIEEDFRGEFIRYGIGEIKNKQWNKKSFPTKRLINNSYLYGHNNETSDLAFKEFEIFWNSSPNRTTYSQATSDRYIWSDEYGIFWYGCSTCSHRPWYGWDSRRLKYTFQGHRNAEVLELHYSHNEEYNHLQTSRQNRPRFVNNSIKRFANPKDFKELYTLQLISDTPLNQCFIVKDRDGDGYDSIDCGGTDC
ncbi:MAG: hypothetical protein ACPG5P_07470, partial [Saprospiraceae bacterium]